VRVLFVTLFDLPPDPSKHGHVKSKDWTEANHCTCGLYRCSVLIALDDEPEAVWPVRG
jgi:hypothetical protein